MAEKEQEREKARERREKRGKSFLSLDAVSFLLSLLFWKTRLRRGFFFSFFIFDETAFEWRRSLPLLRASTAAPLSCQETTS